MSSACRHKKRSHRSEKRHTESKRQMMRFTGRTGVAIPPEAGAFAAFGKHFLGWRRKREKKADR